MQSERLTINIEPRYLAGLRVLARREGRTVSNFLRTRIAAMVDSDPTVLASVVHENSMHNDPVHHAEVAR